MRLLGRVVRLKFSGVRRGLLWLEHLGLVCVLMRLSTDLPLPQRLGFQVLDLLLNPVYVVLETLCLLVEVLGLLVPQLIKLLLALL